MGYKRWLKILTNEKGAKMQKTFNKTFKWDYKKKVKGVLHMLAPRRRYPDYSKVCSDVTERWLSVWNQNKHYI